MPSMPVELLPIAQEDVNQALLYISAEDPFAADQLLERILNALGQASEQPESGIAVMVGKRFPRLYRRLYAAPYCIYYRIIDQKIIVMRVLHERMNVNKHL